MPSPPPPGPQTSPPRDGLRPSHIRPKFGPLSPIHGHTFPRPSTLHNWISAAASSLGIQASPPPPPAVAASFIFLKPCVHGGILLPSLFRSKLFPQKAMVRQHESLGPEEAGSPGEESIPNSLFSLYLHPHAKCNTWHTVGATQRK